MELPVEERLRNYLDLVHDVDADDGTKLRAAALLALAEIVMDGLGAIDHRLATIEARLADMLPP
jgi:hypothetical protein